MAKNTQPVFIVGSGRNGTRSLYRMLTGTEGVKIHHEYVCTHVQKLAALYYMGLIEKKEVKDTLMELHGAAIKYTTDNIWIDSSNKLSWLIEPLNELFPTSKFLLIVRDGRNVVSSFYYKLRDEMYDDNSVKIMENWLNNRKELTIPPPEKKYWWNIPQENQPFYEEFKEFNRLQRAAYHWSECNRFVLECFENLNDDQKMTVRLEDIVNNEIELRKTIEFMGIKYDPLFFEYLQTPRNVFFPLHFQLTPKQNKEFDSICSGMMRKLGYKDKDTYVVNY